jgi:hypothetical protein
MHELTKRKIQNQSDSAWLAIEKLLNTRLSFDRVLEMIKFRRQQPVPFTGVIFQSVPRENI